MSSPSPVDGAQLSALGDELNHHVGELTGIVTPQTYCRWIIEKKKGQESRCVGRPKLALRVRALVTRLAHGNAGWGYRLHYRRISNTPFGGGPFVRKTEKASFAPGSSGDLQTIPC